MRDLSSLQIQIRSLDGYVDSRIAMLSSRPQQRMSWVGLAVSYDLVGNYDLALKVLDAYLATSPPELTFDFDVSEILAYKNQLLLDAGRFQEALDDLDKVQHSIWDHVFLLEQRGDVLLKLQRPAEARAQYEKLLALNPENAATYERLEKCSLHATPAEMYAALHAKNPRSNFPLRKLLDITTGALPSFFLFCSRTRSRRRRV